MLEQESEQESIFRSRSGVGVKKFRLRSPLEQRR